VDALIEARGLTKRFGRLTAVDNLSFSVRAGRVTGFVGPNGAGKSTTMRMILGLDGPDRGDALVAGRPYRSLRTPLRQVGALLDAAAVHPGRRAYQHLLWLAHSNGIARPRVAEVLELVGLSPVAQGRAGRFSLGMRQRLGIAAALLGDPQLLMLDEPVNGLDPEGVVWIRGFLRSLAAEGRAVFVASHLMSELEDTADHLIIIGRGRLITDTSVAELLGSASDGMLTVRTPRRAEIMRVLSAAGAVVSSNGTDALTVSGLSAERVANLAADRGLPLYELTPHRVSLEQVYLKLTRDAVDYPAGSPSRAGSGEAR